MTITDKRIHSVYKKILMVEDGSDDGDGYDYSPLEEDFIVTSEQEKAKICCEKSEYIQSADIEIAMEIPKNLSSKKSENEKMEE